MNTLNPKLFYSDYKGKYKLNQDICAKMKQIADAFIDYIYEQGVNLNVADIQFLGSNAGYDYTDKSDIDLHIISDFDAVTCDRDLLQIALNAERSRFNTSHDIRVKGIPVELYVEDIKSGTVSNGIYSILYDKWIKYPESEDIELPEYEHYVLQWKNIIDNALACDNLYEVQRIINRLYMMRKNGLAARGRFSIGNLVFKKLRNDGLIDALKDKRLELESTQLSLECLLLHKYK